MNENKLIAENSAGITAQLHLDYLKPLLDDVRAELQRQWRDTKPAEALKRENLWRELHCLDAVEGKITRIVQTGSLAKAGLERRGT